MRIAIVFTTAILLLGADYVRCESLGEVAARERERRKEKAAGKVITEADLARAGGATLTVASDDSFKPIASPSKGPAGSETKAPGPGGAPAAEKEKTEEEIRADREVEWRQRLDAANAEVGRRRADLSRLEGQPYAYMNAEQIASARAALADAEQKVTALEEERRRAGYRP